MLCQSTLSFDSTVTERKAEIISCIKRHQFLIFYVTYILHFIYYTLQIYRVIGKNRCLSMKDNVSAFRSVVVKPNESVR